MPRVKRGTIQKRRHNKVLKRTKGFRGLGSRLFTHAKRRLEKAGRYAYAHRRIKKRAFRRLWITRMNAAVRAQGLSYSRFVYLLTTKKVALDRKVLSDIAVHEPKVFDEIVKTVK